LRRLNRRMNYRTLGGIFGVIAIVMILIIGGSSFPNMALSVSSSLNNNKPSSHVPLLSNAGISSNSGIHASNLNGFHNQSSSASLYSAPPSSSSTSGGNISNGVTSSNNKLIMIGFDDSYKSQILYAKPILNKYGFKASFFEVCTWIGQRTDRLGKT
jgi:hypothetical protein